MVDEEQVKPFETPEQPTTTPTPEQPVPGEAPKKKGYAKWIIVGCAVLLVLCLIVAGIIGIGAYLGYKSLSAPVGTIKSQLKAFNDGDIKKGYDYTTEAFKKATPFEQFKKLVEDNPSVFKSKDSSFSNISINNGLATVKGSITGQDGTKTNMTYELVKEGGGWKIQYFKIGG